MKVYLMEVANSNNLQMTHQHTIKLLIYLIHIDTQPIQLLTVANFQSISFMTLDFISSAAFLVNVSANILRPFMPVWRKNAIRLVRVRVLPVDTKGKKMFINLVMHYLNEKMGLKLSIYHFLLMQWSQEACVYRTWLQTSGDLLSLCKESPT